MFSEIKEDVFEFTSSGSWPVVAIIGGVHGNELTGIEVVKELKKDFESGKLELVAGTLILAFGNPRAIALGTRSSNPDTDLNRSFTSQILSGEKKNYEEKRAQDLAIALRNVRVGIDIHATNKPTEPFVVCQTTPIWRHRKIIRWLGARYIITDPKFVFADKPVTLDEYIGRDSGVGICYETGEDKDISRVHEVRTEMEHILVSQGLLAHTKRLEPPRLTQETFTLTQSIVLGEEDDFSYAPEMGLCNFQPVKKGEVVGTRKSGPLIAKNDGVIVFPKIKSLWRVGEPVGYLAERI